MPRYWSWILFRSEKNTFICLTNSETTKLVMIPISHQIHEPMPKLQYYIYLSFHWIQQPILNLLKDTYVSCSPDPTTNSKSEETFIMFTGSNNRFWKYDKTFIILAYRIQQPIMDTGFRWIHGNVFSTFIGTFLGCRFFE